MSEYQYYEFLAMDEPLTSQQMEELRHISTRARITAVSFVNEYNWSDLKADPKDLMRHYFDAHVYLASWGTMVFMLKLPAEGIKAEDLEAFAVHDCLEMEKLPEHWLLTWSFTEEEDYDFFQNIEGENWMALLAPIREELLRGDLRSLYIGWLRGVYLEDAEDTDTEPMALRGLGQLTPAQQALTDFLNLEEDLVNAAGMDVPPLRESHRDEKPLEDWLNTLSEKKMREYLRLLLCDQGAKVERTLKQTYRAWLSRSRPQEKPLSPRPLKEILKRLEEAKQIRLEAEARKKKEKANQERKKRDAFLENLAKDYSKVWDSAHKEAKKGYASAYDLACQHLLDLKEAYAREKRTGDFEKKLEAFRAEHGRRRALMERLISKKILMID